MSEVEGPTRGGSWFWQARVIVAIVLVALSIIGLGLTNFATKDAEWYWLLVIPIFALAGVRVWEKKGFTLKGSWGLLRDQIFHWLGFLAAVQIMYLMIQAGTLDRTAAGLVSLVLLALTSYLAGIHFDRMFLIVALLLAVAAVMATYVDEYMWIVLAILGLVIGAMLLTRRSHRPTG